MRRSWLLLAALALGGCSTLVGGARPAATPEPAVGHAADDSTKEQVAQLRRQAAMAEAEIKMLRRQLAALQVEVERLSETARSPAPEAQPMPRLEAPRTIIESHELEPVRVEPPLAESAASDSAVVPLKTEAPLPATAPVPLSGQSIYDRGYTLYHQGRFIDAESSFQRFLQAHGDTELADNAQFWIGECRFARSDSMGALLAFQEVLDRYPSGNKVADALLKVGDCLMRLENVEGGRQRYEEVLRRFPGSAAAAMAEERLQRPPS